MNENPLLTIKELCTWLRIKESTVRKWVCYGKIPCVRLGRSVLFDGVAIRGWMLKANPNLEKWQSMAPSDASRYNPVVR